MNTAIQCIVLLACIICTSATILNCKCVKTSKAVKASLIAEVHVYEPRPYCNNKEVIVTLKDKSSRCLDPESDFTKAVMRSLQSKAHADNSPKTTTVSATGATGATEATGATGATEATVATVAPTSS